jgi:hypothetical protein
MGVYMPEFNANDTYQFRYFFPTEYLEPLEEPKVPPKEEHIVNKLEPFHSECRAFGRLKEVDRENLADRCYGYIFLDRDQEALLSTKFGPIDWNRREEHEKLPLRALVKDLIEEEIEFTRAQIPRMIRNFKALYSYSIYAFDMKEDNCRNGTLIDLSSAETLPHLTMNFAAGIYSEEYIRELILDSANCFDDIIRRWNNSHWNWPRRYPNNDKKKKKIWHRLLYSARYTKYLRKRPRKCTSQFLEDFWKATQRPDEAWAQSVKPSSKTTGEKNDCQKQPKSSFAIEGN